MFLRELFEAPRKVAVAAFGRMNPPTIGHEKLVDKVKSFEGDHYIFLSQTVKPKDNPLPFDVKLEFAKKFFPGVNVGHPSVRTPIQMLQMLEKLGYTDVIYVAGSDRVASFEKLFNDYNGKEYNFNSITVENAGERDPDADGAEGMSASKMRAAAAAGDFEAFAQGVPTPALAQKMYDAVRTGMGIKDKEPVEEWAGVALKGGKYAFEILKFFWNNKWAIAWLTAAWKTIDWISDAIDFVRKYTDNPLVKGLFKYGMPAVAVAVALYGGKKLYDELVKSETEADLEEAFKKFKADEKELDDLVKELEAMYADDKNEDVSPKDEKKFHNELDDLVHKYFGDSPDEEKMKKKMKKVKPSKETNEILGFATKNQKKTTIKKKRPPEEDSVKDKLAKRRAMASKGDPKAYKSGGLDEGSPITDLKKIITSKIYKQEYLMALKMMKQEAISAADAARRFMHVDARTLDKMAKKLGV
jgi:hypothetical protein